MAVNNGDIIAAVKARWTAKSLGSTVTGGIYHLDTPKDTSMPYVILEVMTNTRTEQANTDATNMVEVHEVPIELRLHHTGGNVAMEAMIDAIDTAFSNCSLSISGANAHYCIRDTETGPLASERHPNARQWILRYMIRYAESKALTAA